MSSGEKKTYIVLVNNFYSEVKMKKLIAILISFSILAALTACGGKKEKTGNKDVIYVNEVTHSIFYAPFYVAIEGGYFDEEGIEIDLTNGGGSDASMAALLSGGADVALLGPETGIYTTLGEPTDAPVIFAQLTKRDGSFLIGRTKEENFDWKNLENKEIIAGRKGGSPAMSLEYALNKNGLYNKQNVTLNFDVQFNLTVAAFEAGTGDYVTMFEPTASEFVRAGKGYMVAAVGEQSGEVPFTCFMAKRSYFDGKQELLERFTAALYKAIRYIDETDVNEVAQTLMKAFPTATITSVTDALNSYKRIDAWQKDMQMTTEAFTRLQDVMENAGELTERVEYDKLVDNGIAERAYKKVFG